jgi:hypothetical protein
MTREPHEDTPDAGSPLPERRKQTTIFKDPRIDKVISWGLGLAGTIVLSLGSWAISGFKEGIQEIKSDLTSVRHEVNASRTEIKGEISDLKTEVALLKQRDSVVGELKSAMMRLEDRLLRLERGDKK